MVEFRILGSPDLRRDFGGVARPIELQPKRLALLGYLGVAGAGAPCRRDRLVALFWPDADESRARNALNQAVHEIRRALGRDVLKSHGSEGLSLSRTAIWLDVRAFDEAVSTNRVAEAMELYRGELLEGVHVRSIPDFEHWLEAERERLLQRACNAALSLADEAEGRGNLAGAARWLRRLLDIAPAREPELRRLMELLAAVGDRAGAIREFEAAERTLKRDYDISPAPETKAVAQRIRRASSEGSATTALAVLPFENLNADPEQEYFCDGLTEEIINGLSKLKGLRVAARTSTFAFKNKQVDVREVGRKLNVDKVLEGSVRRSADRLRVNVQLVNIDDGCHLWSERYDRRLADIFDIQDDIARSVSAMLEVQLLGGPAGPAVRRPAEIEAYTAYLRGLFLLNKRTPDAIRRARELLEEAVEIDGRFAEAHASLAFCYVLGGYFLYDVFAPEEAWPLARASAQRALELDDQLSDAFVSLGMIQLAFELDVSGSEESLTRAIGLNPNNANALGQYAIFLVLAGRFEESDAVVRRAEALDPLALMPRVYVGVRDLASRQYREARRQFATILELEPRFFAAHLLLGDTNRFAGDLDKALTSYDEVLAIIGRQPLILSRIASLHATAGRSDRARELLDEMQSLEPRRHILPSFLADVFVALGEDDAMFDCLQEGREIGDSQLSMFRVWPAYDAVRSNPRFAPILGQTWPVVQKG